MKNAAGWLASLLLVALPANEAGAQGKQAQTPGYQRSLKPEPGPDVWFTSNVGGLDMLDLFTRPDEWAETRALVDVFMFNGGQVGSAGWSCTVNPTSACGPNHLDNFASVQAFAKLQQWGIDVSVESFFAGPIMAVNPVQCSTSSYIQPLTLNGSLNYIQSVESNGGVVRYLRMDEPVRQWYPTYYYLITGQTDPRPCLISTLDPLADEVAAYILQMQVWFPEIDIGQVELYPEVGVDQLKQWVLALEARGVLLPFLHLDVHWPRVEQYNAWGLNIDVGADLRELRTFAEQRGMQLGVIFTDVTWDSKLWLPGEYDDRTYFENTLTWVDYVKSEHALPHHAIFQSWVYPYFTTGPGPNQVPINLPEDIDSVYSHTRLILAAQ